MAGHGYIPLDPTLQDEAEASPAPTRASTRAPWAPGQTPPPGPPTIRAPKVLAPKRPKTLAERRVVNHDASFRVNNAIRVKMTHWMTLHPEVATISEGYRTLIWLALENMDDHAAFASGFREGLYRSTSAVMASIQAAVVEASADGWEAPSQMSSKMPPKMPPKAAPTPEISADAMQMHGFVDDENLE